MSQPKTVKLKVPDGAEQGDSVTFIFNGQEMEIPIPEGSKPGDVLQIQLGGSDNDEDGPQDSDTSKSAKDSEVTQVQLHSSVGVVLDIYSSIPDAEENDEEENDGADGTYAMAWPAGLHLAKHISSPSLENVIKDAKTVVELGSGSGVCGLAFVATASSKLSKRKGDAKKLNVLLTDMPSAMDLLEYNMKVNKDQLSSHIDEQSFRAKPLVWGKDTSALSLGSVDLILGSDLLYNVSIETFKALSSTIQAVDTTKKAKIVLSVRWRKPEEERTFFQEMESAGYEFNLLQEASDKSNLCDLEWREFGNPSCQRSNEFFTNSYVQVDGKSKPLKDVSEEDMDVMSDGEYEAFEKRFIQIYVGQKTD